MTSLPEADAATREYFIRWLETFARHVRDVDYAAARPLFHPDVLAFGTRVPVEIGFLPRAGVGWLGETWVEAGAKPV